MTYGRHIQRLQDFLTNEDDGGYQGTFVAAIALMRAADAEIHALEPVQAELAAAKAEIERLRAACDRAAIVLKGVNTSARNQCLGALIGVDEPEYRTASAKHSTKLANLRAALEQELSAAKAEIEHFKGVSEGLAERCTSVTRANEHLLEQLAAAIEASR